MNEFSIEDIFTSDSSDSLSDSVVDNGLYGYEKEVEQSSSDGSTEIDYSSLLTDINTDVNSLIYEVDNLNDSVCTLNENIKICTGLVFVLVVLVGIKYIYHILTSILGIGLV